MRTEVIPDQGQRSQAVVTPGHAFVWASAGTGKTHTLTLRALYLLLTAPFRHPHPDPLPQTARERGSGNPASTACGRGRSRSAGTGEEGAAVFQSRPAGRDGAALYTTPKRADRLRAARAIARRVVLTTFTRKAAAEMLTRLYAYLDHLATAPSLNALRKKVATLNDGRGDDQFIEIIELVLEHSVDFDALRLGAEALAELATELQICTLHSYAATILRRHPIAAGIPPTAQFAEEDDSTRLDPTEQLIDRWWQHVVADPTLHAQLQELVEFLPIGQMQPWLGAIIKHPWLVDEMDIGRPDPKILGEIGEATRLLVAALQDARKSYTSIIAARDALRDAIQRVERTEPGAWLHCARTLLAHDESLFEKPTAFTAAAIDKLGGQARYYRDFAAVYLPVLRQCLATDLARPWQLWRAFTRAFADWAEGAVVRELDLITFDEMVRRAACLLADNDEVRREERERIGALLVDEFQDTDPVQLGLLQHLIGRASPDDHEIIGFFVGDRKQSIYRFRDADLPAIDRFVAQYHTLAKVGRTDVRQFQLTSSFRSLKPITNFVNQFFQQGVELPNYAAEKLEPVRTARGELPEWRLLEATPEGHNAGGRRLQAARETARLIDEYVTTGGGAYDDVVVLVNTHQELDAVLPILERAAIPSIGSGAHTFFQKPEVLDVLNLLIALHNPHDSLAVGALLRSPLIGLSDPDIHHLLGEIKTSELLGADRPLPACLEGRGRQRLEMLRSLRIRRGQVALGEWLGALRQFIPTERYAQNDPEGRALVRIDNVLAGFRRMVEAAALPPLQWLLDQRARVNQADQHDAEMGEDVSVTDETRPAVQVMTIHKAKGLQGRFVIVYGWQKALGKLVKRNECPACIRLTSRNGIAMSGFRLPWGELEIMTQRYAEAVDEDQELEVAEAARTTYVAATRACDRLVLLSHDCKDLERAPLLQLTETLVNGTTVRTALSGTVIVSVVTPPTVDDRTIAPLAGVEDTETYARIWRERMTLVTDSLPPLLNRPSQPEQAAETEALDASDYAGPRSERAREIALAAGTLAHRYLERHVLEEQFNAAQLLPPTADQSSIGWLAHQKALAALRGFFGSPIHARIRRARVLGRELPLYLQADEKSWTGVMDLILEEAGAIVGIDYKFMAQTVPLPIPYARQEKLYTEALRRLFPGRAVRFEFLWLGDQ